MNWYAKVLFVALLAVAFQHFARLTYIFLSLGNTVVKHYPGKCQHVKGFTTRGSEDMTLLPSGKLIITSGLAGLGEFDYTKDVLKGQLYVMDTNKDTNSVNKLTVKGWPANSHFEPHGIDHWVHENKSVSIFVVMHMPERVARFLYDGAKTVTLTKLYENSTFMRNINSVLCTGEDSFYLTNLLHARHGDKLMINMELMLYMPFGSIIRVDGDNCMYAADGFLLSNGLVGDSSYVYVATKGAVRIFTKRSDNTLKQYKTIPLDIGSIDNVQLDASGDLWLGCQNGLAEVIGHLKKTDELKSHSTVIRVRDPLGAAEMESVFVDDTSLIQASTTGVYTKGKLLIGSICDKMVSCDVNYLVGV